MVVFGGRNFGLKDREMQFIIRSLDAVLRQRAPTVLIEGEATGVDTVAREWGKAKGLTIISVPADWDNITRPGAVIRYHRDGRPYDAAAGTFRNQIMIDLHKPDFGVRYPGGRGTIDMGRRMKKSGIEVVDLNDRWALHG